MNKGKNQKIYVSGPMTGIYEYNRPAFEAATELLNSRGWQAINPSAYDSEVKGTLWRDFLKKDLKLLAECDAICCLPGWENSDGARLEVSIMFELGLPIYFLTPSNMFGVEIMMHRTNREQKKG